MDFSNQLRTLDRILKRAIKLLLGRLVFAFSSDLGIKKRLAFVKEDGKTTIESICGDCLKYFVQKEVLGKGRTIKSKALNNGLESIVNADEALAEFDDCRNELKYAEAGICNTEATVLWGLIKTFKPELYIESGTARGYSAQVANLALEKLSEDFNLVTVGIDAGGQMDVARNRLAPYKNCEIVEDSSEKVIPPLLENNSGKRVGIFIDGPKGSSRAFLILLESIFQKSRPVFVAIHDCEDHIPYGFDKDGKRPEGFINLSRSGVEYFYHKQGLDNEYAFYFMSDDWCNKHENINAPVYELLEDFRPYYFNKSKQVSHSTIMAVLLNRDRLSELHHQQENGAG